MTVKRPESCEDRQAEDDGRYYALNATERGIVDAWIKSGMTRKMALDTMYRDLADAAEEDGYDGP